ncbi:hypothetical protein [Aureimonas sp. AU40]|uniref:hypothetical protein n=1 Tax=Aureimonas sp. AU40 TaxID=1637747 RepID=UPI0012E342B0|nr:hypothetical protein [Aureimonas sp. AU40]
MPSARKASCGPAKNSPQNRFDHGFSPGIPGRVGQREDIMAKGQMRSNKETRKPKADKTKKVEPTAIGVPGKFATPQKDTKK